MKKVIFNADDFALTKSVTDGILKAFKEGVVTSTSILATTSNFNYAIKLLRKNSDLDCGIHLTLDENLPLYFKNFSVPKLEFLKVSYLVGNVLKMREEDIERELRAQIERVLDNKIRVSHITGHYHIHLLPKVVRVVVKLANEFSIDKVRLPYEVSRGFFFNQYFIKAKIVSLRAKFVRDIFINNKIKFPNYFYGMCRMGSKDSLNSFFNVLDSVRDGVTEIMCHPGYVSEELKRMSSYVKEREFELMALINEGIKERIKKNGIKLSSYKCL